MGRIFYRGPHLELARMAGFTFYMSTPSLQLNDLHFAYPDGTAALRGVSFEVMPGEAVALVGGNGAGKSTLLLHLNGYLHPQQGTVSIQGSLLNRETAAVARRAVGLVFQNPEDQLFMPTVHDDVAFGPQNAGLDANIVADRVDASLQRVGAAHLKNRPPYRLSAGEKRAVAIATVLAMQPDILVMDEPSSHLDPKSRRRLIQLLQSFEHTRIIATHDLEMVVEVCARVIVLDGGKVVASGPTREILNDEALMLAHGLERPHILKHLHPH
jgi:cobalt/nickel transport system ATP-binding protein